MFLEQSMILTKSKLAKGIPQALQINKKVIVVIKLVFKDEYFNKLPSYNNINITTLKMNKHVMKEGWKLKLN
jgi:hypothetical protein